MAREVELKLSIPESAQSRFPRQPLLAKAASRRTVRLVNLYYDTPRLDLMRRGIALRLRKAEGRWLQTVKLSAPSEGGLTSRPEWETPYGGHFDFSAVDDKGTRRFLEEQGARGRLAPIFETSFRRTTWKVESAGGVVEVMLDRGWIAAAGRREPISEVEIEGVAGGMPPIFAVARALARRIPLAPAQRSKAERGYRLFSGKLPQPQKAENPAMHGDFTPRRAFRETAFACLAHLHANRDGAMERDDPEYVHQVRVAIRRLRAALRLFGPALPPDLGAALLPELKTMGSLLGGTRDLDVLHTEIVAPVLAECPDEPGLAALDGEITERRFAARSMTREYLASAGYGAAMVAASERLALLDEELPDAAGLGDFAGRRLRRLHRRVVALAASADPADPDALHALRIAVKRLRYGLEFFGPMTSRRRLARLATRLAEAQETLGKLNDLANAGRLLADCAGSDPRLRDAVGIVGEWHRPRHARLLDGVPTLLARLARMARPRIR
ncbi:MAG: CYTH and CHAD domain-containing protein [Rhodocyclaceae bacterium]|nr:CYTH and CHAD domain-containing protein [Rhodocyclaceae bacterium]